MEQAFRTDNRNEEKRKEKKVSFFYKAHRYTSCLIEHFVCYHAKYSIPLPWLLLS